MPTGVLQRYLEGLADEQYLELRDEVALVDSRIGELLGRLGNQGIDGTAATVTWKEIRTLIDERRRLVESARQHVRETQSTITVEEALAMVEALNLAIRHNVPDPRHRRAIAAELVHLLKPMQTK